MREGSKETQQKFDFFCYDITPKHRKGLLIHCFSQLFKFHTLELSFYNLLGCEAMRMWRWVGSEWVSGVKSSEQSVSQVWPHVLSCADLVCCSGTGAPGVLSCLNMMLCHGFADMDVLLLSFINGEK